VLAAQRLPHSLGLLYEELTAHLGFRRSSDEYKVMAMASYGEPEFLDEFRELVRADGNGGFTVAEVDLSRFAEPLAAEAEFTPAHAALAASVQRRLEEVLLELAGWLRARTGERDLAMAGGVALNCVANSRLWRESPFERIWVQPAAGDAGTALGAAMQVAADLGDRVQPMPGAALGREWDDDTLAAQLRTAGIAFERPDDVADAVAEVLAADGVVAWFQGRSEYGPRALGTWRSSTTSRAASSSAPWRRWCSPSARRRSSTARCPRRTCSSLTACARGGTSASRRSSTSTAPRACRP
jgi:carbamoyltransferase